MRLSSIVILSISALGAAGMGMAQSAPAHPTLTLEERGDLYMARKMYREAIDTYADGLKTLPRARGELNGKPAPAAVLWDKVGIACHQLGDLIGARKAYEKAIKVDKKYADAINNVGTIYYAEKKYRSAISRYQRALQYAPDSASIWSNLGTAWYARGKFDLMTQAYTKALALDPDVFEKHGSVGTRMQDRGVADKARYHFEMARMYAGSGKNELALQYLRKALEEGYKEKDQFDQIKEFSTLRETQEFKDLMTLEPRVL
ncbi:MAG TPA: tetratricopeptide repeat protein [Bryobacteraceae bacterium]|jgi:tetratricopeptide (TPR) repeat protein|nr:tetratricopeptide repeat protein [Bryobacteraceae bacterium]